MTFQSWVLQLTVPADMGPSAVREGAGCQLVLNADFSALMVHHRKLRACAPVAGALLLWTEVSPAQLALCCLLNCRLLLQRGPRGKGAVNDLMVVSLTAEAPTSRCLGCCSIQYGYVELLVKGTQRQVVDCTLVSELGIVAQDHCPVETLVQIGDVPPVMR